MDSVITQFPSPTPPSTSSASVYCPTAVAVPPTAMDASVIGPPIGSASSLDHLLNLLLTQHEHSTCSEADNWQP